MSAKLPFRHGAGATIAPDTLRVGGATPLRGTIRVPGDKGISHRALLFAALADGTSRVSGITHGDDVARTRRTARRPRRSHHTGGLDAVRGRGAGPRRWSSRRGVLDCGNSGTSIRTVTGLLAGRPFLAVLSGDESLRARPMRRIVEPLRAMGAHVDGRADGSLPPLVVRGGDLLGCTHALAVASAQVKTALVLAGLQASGTTEIVEPAPSRDHTERMLAALGAPVVISEPGAVRVTAGAPAAFDLDVPGDPSSAAFWCVAATITPGSEITLVGVGLNPTRIAFVDVLRRMGASLELVQTGESLGEPVGDIRVMSGPLRASAISGDEIPLVQDEIPVLAVAAAFAEGVTEVHRRGRAAREGERSHRDRRRAAHRPGCRCGDLGRRVRDPRRRSATRTLREPRRSSHRDGGGGRRERGRRRVGGVGLARGRGVVSRVRRRPRDLDRPRTGGAVTGSPGTARVVAIDGPAGSGKSTVARGVASALGLHTLDTGAMYRAVTLAALEASVDLEDADAVTRVAEAADVELDDGEVRLGGRDVSAAIRGPEVTGAVSAVSSHPGVRSVLVARQRAWVTEHDGGVVEGRDIGTVVLPDAPVKVFLTASDEVRAQRRHRDEADAARATEVTAVQAAIAQRDRADATLGRALRLEDAAADALVIDTSELGPDEVIARIVERARMQA